METAIELKTAVLWVAQHIVCEGKYCMKLKQKRIACMCIYSV